ncbi:MAG: hypothetical protein M1142_04450 [Patescibacteria group bacterium]|nr:hypothetical protein [Patescibacteria group bacterium]
MIKKVTVILLAIILLNAPYIAYAAESSPSADIRAKLEELKEEIASKAAKLKQIIDRKLKDKAYVGKIKSKSDTSITVATDSGPKIVSINQDTVFDSNVKSKTKFSQKTMALEDYIAALGDSDETGVLTAKEIILLPAPKDQPKTYLWGQIVSISDQLVTLRNNQFKNIATTLPDRSEVKLNNFVILTGNEDKNNIFDARFAYVIPQGGTIKPKKVATPSAQISTPSVHPATGGTKSKPTP